MIDLLLMTPVIATMAMSVYRVSQVWAKWCDMPHFTGCISSPPYVCWRPAQPAYLLLGLPGLVGFFISLTVIVILMNWIAWKDISRVQETQQEKQQKARQSDLKSHSPAHHLFHGRTRRRGLK